MTIALGGGGHSWVTPNTTDLVIGSLLQLAMKRGSASPFWQCGLFYPGGQVRTLFQNKASDAPSAQFCVLYRLSTVTFYCNYGYYKFYFNYS